MTGRVIEDIADLDEIMDALPSCVPYALPASSGEVCHSIQPSAISQHLTDLYAVRNEPVNEIPTLLSGDGPDRKVCDTPHTVSGHSNDGVDQSRQVGNSSEMSGMAEKSSLSTNDSDDADNRAEISPKLARNFPENGGRTSENNGLPTRRVHEPDDAVDFDWCGPGIIIPEQPRTAVYRNPFNAVVIRQLGTGEDGDDQYVILADVPACRALIKALRRQIGEVV